MRLGMVGTASGKKAVLFHDGQPFQLSALDASLPDCLHKVLLLDKWFERVTAAAKRLTSAAAVDGPIAAPIAKPNKVICIGLNYSDHAKESGVEPPAEPIVFNKFASSIIGPEEKIVLPKASTQVDYEAELVVVIGKRGRHISKEQALSYVAGYMNGNDVSARDWQLQKPGKQWLMGKTADTFAPIGPYLVTTDEIPQPGQLPIALRLNGATMQNSSTKELIFGIEEIIAYISQMATLEPGDLIFTGTPPGVGMARKPPVFLKPGDVCEVEIAGLGVLRNGVVGE